MKYTQEMTEKLVADYTGGRNVDEMAAELNVPKRSVIAKLSSLGVYKAKVYVNKRGEQPIKKEEYIVRIASLLGIDVNLLDSMEKVTKTALTLIESAVAKMQADANEEIEYWKANTDELEAELEARTADPFTQLSRASDKAHKFRLVPDDAKVYQYGVRSEDQQVTLRRHREHGSGELG